MADSGGVDFGGADRRGENRCAAQSGPIGDLEFQMRAFEAAVGPQDWTRYSEMAGFTEWLAGVSRISPAAPMLGVVWQAALLSLIRGGPGRFEMLAVGRAMTETDAAVLLGLLRFGGVARGAQPSRPLARRLCELGLLRPILGRSRLTPLGARLDQLIGEIRAGR
jgi:hypothetical protein